jgi:CHAT domain-containing protein
LQESVDVVLTLRSPNGKPWAPLDTLTLVPEPEVLRVVAPSDGRYVLDVASARKGAAGPFRLEVMELRRAGAHDRLLAQAQDDLARAEQLRRQNEPASGLRALPLYKQAVRLFRQAGDAGSEGYARIQWARVLASQNRKREAAASLRGCLALSSAAQAPGARAKAATMLAVALSNLGDSAGAEAADHEALAAWRRLRQPTWEAQVINHLAEGAVRRGELAAAESLYRQSLSLWEASGVEKSAAVTMGNLAGVYNLAGEPQLALDSAEQGLARFPKGASPQDVAGVLEKKGEALDRLGHHEEAQSTFSEALTLSQGKPAELAQLERRLARRAYDKGNFDEAAKRFQSAITTLEAAQDRPSAMETRQDLAWTELKRGHQEVAEKLFQRIATDSSSTQNRWIKPAMLEGQARLERARGHLKPALAFARRALDEVEVLRSELGRTDLKTSVFADQQSYFDLAADLTLDVYGQTGDRFLLGKAFEISERSRARRLLDLLATGPSPPAPSASPGETRAAKALSRAEARLKTLRSAEAAGAEIERAERKVRKAVLDLRREEVPSGAAGPSFGGSPLSLRQIQHWIDRDTVLLEFDLGEDAGYLWAVTSQRLAVHRLPRQIAVEAQVRDAIGVLSSPGVSADSVQGKTTLLATARLLVGEAMPELVARRWLLVMDGALHALPLGALPNPDHPEEPILATHEIAFAPSASVAVRLSQRAERNERQRRQGPKPQKDLALFADAVYEAGRPEAESPSGLLRLPRLRYSDEEARRILALVPSQGRLDARRFEATKARVLSGELADYRRLHFAVHGLPDENHPELSGLALSLFDRQGRPQDGILFAHEIARLHLPADLAVLSACQSGRGAAVSGEGLVGLAHAFFTAGTARVVASEWAVNDQATAELMGLFYDGLLRRHLNAARALQEAQIAIAREAPWRRPYFWAGFVVQGGF